jgi:hypothetical protein
LIKDASDASSLWALNYLGFINLEGVGIKILFISYSILAFTLFYSISFY